MAGVSYREEIDEIKTNIEDRFGKIPKEVEALFYVAYIRIICKEMGIKEIIEKESKIELVFSSDKKIDFNKIMREIKDSKGKIYLLGDKPNSIFLKIDDDLSLEKKWEYLKKFLERIRS
jgi:transcription-repair coupling factor (superfamily II helicase)